MTQDNPSLRDRILDNFGSHGTHAIEDGAVLGVIFGLLLTFPLAVALITLVVFGDAMKPRKVIQNADEWIRREQIQNQLLHFALSFGGGSIIGIGLGVVFRITVAWSGVSIPDIASILVGV